MRTPEMFKIRGDQKMESPCPSPPVLMRFPKISPSEYTELYKKALIYIQNFMLEFELSQSIRVVIWLALNGISRLYGKSCASPQEMKTTRALLPYLIAEGKVQPSKWRYQETLKFNTQTRCGGYLYSGDIAQSQFTSEHFTSQALSSLRWPDYFKKIYKRRLRRISTSMFYISLRMCGVKQKVLQPSLEEY